MKIKTQLCFFCKILVLSLFTSDFSSAQIVPDATLPSKSNVIYQDNTAIIEGGTKSGENLFHSFKEFSIPANLEASFNNASSIKNIFTRVTSNSISNIDGILSANGAVNLFLVNPNGVIFGPNAIINIGGSFLATTANNIQFEDGVHFSTNTKPTTPILTSSVPVGLGFNRNVAGIRVKGSGHNVSVVDFQPISRGDSASAGLRVEPQRTLALVGGDLSLEGGILTAESGRVEIGSVINGTVGINFTSLGFLLNYKDVNSFGDISLTQRSLVDASGLGGSSIQVQGGRLQINNSSLILIQNEGLFSTGSLTVNASKSLEITDVFVPGQIRSAIWSETLGFAKGSDITISVPRLTISGGAQIFSSTYGDASAPDINLYSTSIKLLDSLISSTTLGKGASGNLSINTDLLSVADGGIVAAVNAFSPFVKTETGNSGNIFISADSVKVYGTSSNNSLGSVISALTLFTGRAGNLVIDTRKLKVFDGGRIDSSSSALGVAGDIIINASESIEVSGTMRGSNVSSSIQTISGFLEEEVQGLSPEFIVSTPQARAGTIFIETKQLDINNGGQISVRNDGLSSAGNIEIIADSITFEDSGKLTASTALSQGGNIILNTDSLRLRNDSLISATAGGSGDGGNIIINADTIVGSGNSDITANAFQGRGGQIEINTEGIFGLFVREELTPLNDITAFSETNPELNGEVLINIDTDLQNDLETQEVDVASVDQLIASSCLDRNRSQSSFTRRGTGAIPPTPDTGLPVWEIPDSSATPQNNWQLGDPIIEATNLQPDSQGDLQIVATNTSTHSTNTCF